MTPRRDGQALLLALGLVLAVFVLYWPVRTHGFVSYDDEVYLLDNPHVAKGLDAREIGWVLSHDHAANYHPLTWIAHMLDVQLFGFEPGPHHLVNVWLHALNAVLVFFLARALLANPWAAALAAALFALHPLRVESVAWASERKDVLCAFFTLAALLAYLRYGRAPSLARYLAVAGLFVLALAAKPMAVTFPCLALLFDVWPLARLDPERPWRARALPDGRRPARVFLEKLPLFALAALGALSTWFAQEVGGATSNTLAVPLELRCWNALASYGVYLRESFWPARLAVFHPLAAVVSPDARAVLLLPALSALLVLVGVSVFAWRRRVRWPWFAVGWCWFLGTLVPVIGLKQVGAQAHADRYTYLPLLGIAWIVAGLAAELVRRRARARVPLAVGAVLVLASLSLTARAQLSSWRDTRALFEHAVAVSEDNYVAHAALGALALREGALEEARAQLLAAQEIYSLDVATLTSLGRLEFAAGDLDAAQGYLERARQLVGTKWVRYELGRVRFARGDLVRAAREFEAALALDPSLVDAHYNLGQIRYAQGRKPEARAAFEQALSLDPRHAGAQNGMGALALDAGDLPEAERRFTLAIEAAPELADAVNNLGVALERQGRTAEARQRYAEAKALYQAQRKP